MKIAIVGTGYVGLVTGTCFAEMGTEVFCVDVNAEKITNLKQGIIPIYEPGLEEMVHRNQQAGRLHFTTDLTECLNEVEVLFSAVGTPPDEDGSADLKYVLEVARIVGRNMTKHLLVVTKSTVPPSSSRSERTSSMSARFKERSREEKGSSIKRSLCGYKNARAMETRCFSPPESSCG